MLLFPGLREDELMVLTLLAGKVLYEKAAGMRKLSEPDGDRMQLDSLCWIASMTKMVTSVAVMQLVDRGIITLEDDVRDYVPELKDLCVLKSVEEGKPVTENIEGKVTIRWVIGRELIFLIGRRWLTGIQDNFSRTQRDSYTTATPHFCRNGQN